MAVTISKELEGTIRQAFGEARRRRHEFVTLEHLLYSMLEEKTASRILNACGADLVQLTVDLEAFFSEKVETLPEDVEKDPEQTAAFWRVMQRAALHVQSSGKGDIESGDLLVAMYREPESYAVYLLQQQ